jgi:hypothetical protein
MEVGNRQVGINDVGTNAAPLNGDVGRRVDTNVPPQPKAMGRFAPNQPPALARPPMVAAQGGRNSFPHPVAGSSEAPVMDPTTMDPRHLPPPANCQLAAVGLPLNPMRQYAQIPVAVRGGAVPVGQPENGGAHRGPVVRPQGQYASFPVSNRPVAQLAGRAASDPDQADRAPANQLGNRPVETPPNPLNGPGRRDLDQPAPMQNVGGAQMQPEQRAALEEHAVNLFRSKLEAAGLPQMGDDPDPRNDGYWTRATNEQRAQGQKIIHDTIAELSSAVNGLSGSNTQNSLLASLGNWAAQGTAMLQFQMEMAKAFIEILKSVGSMIAHAARPH